MSANDRGTIKWTSLMLPEHVKMLNDIWQEDNRKEKPILDEQQKIEINGMLQLALKDNLTVAVTYYDDYDHHTVKSKLLSFDVLSKKLKFANGMEIILEAIIEADIL